MLGAGIAERRALRGRARRSSARATDLIFAGVVGRQMPDGTTKEQAVDGLRAQGDDGLADMLSGVDFTPGSGIDFDAVGQVLLVALVVYVGAGLLMLVSTRLSIRVINRAVFRLREDVEAKLARLPLSYFDQQQRGEVLSRATNDIDNIAQTLQQTMGQLINSLLTIVGVLAMMFWISPLLALVALVTVPLSVFVATRIGKRSQPQFVAQWKVDRQAQRPHRGDVHRPRAGQGLRAAGGVREGLRRAQRGAVRVGLQGAVHLRDHPAADDVHRQPELRAGRGRRRAAGGVGYAVDRRRAGVHPVLAAVQPAADPGRVHGQPGAVRRRVGRAGLRPARRRGAGAGPGLRRSGRRSCAAASRSRTCRSGTTRTSR